MVLSLSLLRFYGADCVIFAAFRLLTKLLRSQRGSKLMAAPGGVNAANGGVHFTSVEQCSEACRSDSSCIAFDADDAAAFEGAAGEDYNIALRSGGASCAKNPQAVPGPWATSSSANRQNPPSDCNRCDTPTLAHCDLAWAVVASSLLSWHQCSRDAWVACLLPA